MFNYVIEVIRRDGTWVQGSIWACHRDNFRDFLSYINELAFQHTVRIRRAADYLETEFQWPLVS